MFVAFASENVDRVARTLMAVQAAGHGHLHWCDQNGFGWSDGNDATAAYGAAVALGRANIQAVDSAPSALRDGAALDLALHTYLQSGNDLAKLAGVFAFVVWDRHTLALHAIRDQLGLSPLYWTDRDGDLFVSDSLKIPARSGQTDPQALRQFIVQGHIGPARSVWKGVQPLPAASILGWRAGTSLVTKRYFSLTTCRVSVPERTDDIVAEGRRLMIEAVQTAATARRFWTDLSGGHDSSSVASIAGWLQIRSKAVNCGGTVTFVDSIGEGDERAFVNAVLKQYALESITVVDPCPWDSDGAFPPLTPAPSRDYPFWKRDRFLSSELTRRHCETLFSGIGPDYYLPLTCAHALDLVRQGRVADASEVFADWTIQNRSNFWREAYRELLSPLMPSVMQRRWLRPSVERPPWLRQDFVADRDFRALQVERDVVRAWPGSICDSRVAQRFSEIPCGLEGWRNLDGVTIDHPLLYLPLVQFCLSVDWRLRTNFSNPKPLLRKAMAGIVPDVVLNRSTKGSLVLPRVVWAFSHHRQRLRSLLAAPVLGDLGVVEPARMLHAIDEAAAGRAPARYLYFALSLETWLSARAKRTELIAA